MIITTTSNVEGKIIVEYKGIVFGEVIAGIHAFKDIAASWSNFFGGRSKSYEKETMRAREAALRELQARAIEVGANAIVGVKFDYEMLGPDNGMMMVVASGTAVIIE